jgi:hypothetical protein
VLTRAVLSRQTTREVRRSLFGSPLLAEFGITNAAAIFKSLRDGPVRRKKVGRARFAAAETGPTRDGSLVILVGPPFRHRFSAFLSTQQDDHAKLKRSSIKGWRSCEWLVVASFFPSILLPLVRSLHRYFLVMKTPTKGALRVHLRETPSPRAVA